MEANHDLSKLLKDVHECWVALNPEQSKIVGRGETMRDAEMEAHKQGIKEPVLLWAPKRWDVAVYEGQLNA